MNDIELPDDRIIIIIPDKMFKDFLLSDKIKQITDRVNVLEFYHDCQSETYWFECVPHEEKK